MNRAYNYVTIDHPELSIRNVPAQAPPQGMWVEPKDPDPLSEDIGEARVKDLFLPHFSARVTEGVYRHDGMLENTSAEGLNNIGFCLFLKGSFETSDDAALNFRIFQGTQNFKFDPQNRFRHRVSAGTAFNVVHFTSATDYFMSFLPPQEAWADKLREKIFRGDPMMGDRSPFITLAQDRALQVVLDCPLKGKLGELMVETAIQQIILIQLDAIFNQAQSPAHGMSSHDKRILLAVRDHLHHHFLDDHSLADLSRHFGLNTNKLMALFRRLFGKSVFEFIGELRMDYAQSRLREGAKVNDVARDLGYRNPNHFSTAYKRKFGVAPSLQRLA